MELSAILYFLLTSVLLTLAPGPDNMYLLAKSLADGAPSGIALALGLASGIAFHTALVILGVAALIQESPTAFTVLKYFGALYLLYLSWGAFRAAGKVKAGTAGAPASRLSLYRQGVLMNILNPKVLLFFLAFLPQFVRPEAGSLRLQIAFLGLLFAAQAAALFSAIAVGAGRVRRFLQRRKNAFRVLGLMESAVLLLLALALILH